MPADLPSDLPADLNDPTGPGRARPAAAEGAPRGAPGWLWALTLATFAMSTAGGALFAASMAGLMVCWALRPVALAAVLPLLAMWSLAAWWVPPPTAARLLALAGPTGPQALALNSSAVYLGVSGGGALGGALLARYGGAALPVAGAVAALAGLALFACAGRLARR